MGARLVGAGRLAAAVALSQLGVQAGELGMQGYIFLGFELQVVPGQGQAVLDASRGETVGALFARAFRIRGVNGLEVPIVHQGLEQLVDRTDADTQLLRQFALTADRVHLQQPQHPKVRAGVALEAQ